MIEKIVIAMIAVFLLIVAIGTYSQWLDCDERDGILVRGLFGLICIDKQ